MDILQVHWYIWLYILKIQIFNNESSWKEEVGFVLIYYLNFLYTYIIYKFKTIIKMERNIFCNKYYLSEYSNFTNQ